MFTLLWLQHQHLSWTFPWLEAADTPSFDSLGGGGAASSLLFLMDVLTSASLSDSQWAARQCEASGNDEKWGEALKHSSRGLITRKPMAPTSKLIGNLWLKHFICFGSIFLEGTWRNAADANIGNISFKTLIVIYRALAPFDCRRWTTVPTRI